MVVFLENAWAHNPQDKKTEALFSSSLIEKGLGRPLLVSLKLGTLLDPCGL